MGPMVLFSTVAAFVVILAGPPGSEAASQFFGLLLHQMVLLNSGNIHVADLFPISFQHLAAAGSGMMIVVIIVLVMVPAVVLMIVIIVVIVSAMMASMVPMIVILAVVMMAAAPAAGRRSRRRRIPRVRGRIAGVRRGISRICRRIPGVRRRSARVRRGRLSGRRGIEASGAGQCRLQLHLKLGKLSLETLTDRRLFGGVLRQSQGSVGIGSKLEDLLIIGTGNIRA